MDQFFANVHEEKPIKNLKAIVCPHAGYIYSGQVAAYSYKALEDHLRSKHSNLSTTFVILAPSHYEYFNGVSVGLYEAFETPL
jgi:AmmeMemoRadiSam system protein B